MLDLVSVIDEKLDLGEPFLFVVARSLSSDQRNLVDLGAFEEAEFGPVSLKVGERGPGGRNGDHRLVRLLGGGLGVISSGFEGSEPVAPGFDRPPFGSHCDLGPVMREVRTYGNGYGRNVRLRVDRSDSNDRVLPLCSFVHSKNDGTCRE